MGCSRLEEALFFEDCAGHFGRAVIHQHKGKKPAARHFFYIREDSCRRWMRIIVGGSETEPTTYIIAPGKKSPVVRNCGGMP